MRICAREEINKRKFGETCCGMIKLKAATDGGFILIKQNWFMKSGIPNSS